MKINKLIRAFLLSGAVLSLIQLSSCRKHDDDHCGYPPPVSKPVLEVWLHRVDNINKAQHFQYAYTGFELDVHFDTTLGTFVVKHDFTDTTHLRFTTWLSAIDDPGRLGFWLDFKNLDMNNRFAAQKELIRIRKEFDLTRRPIVVEGSFADCLHPFDTLNFWPSFYLPTFDPDTLNAEDLQFYLGFINEFVAKDSIKRISAYYFQHSFMQTYYPSLHKLLWYLDSTDPKVKDSIIAQTKQDTTVQVLLVAEDYTGTLKPWPENVKYFSSKRKLIK